MSGGSTTSSDTTTNQINQIPAWMSDAGQQNYAYAQNVAMQPLQQYQGQMVADVAPQTQQAWDVAANSGNVGADQYNAASAGYLNAMNQSPMMNTAAQSGLSQTGSSNLSSYMNPFTSSVINATLPIMQQQLGLSQDAQQNAASAANAYGGSRQGVQQGVTQAQGAMNMAQMAAQLNMANYNQARQASEFDVGQANNMGQFNAGQTNTVAGQNQIAQQAGVNSGIQAAYGLTNTGQSMNAANAANYNLLQSAGAGQSMQAQNQINSQMAKFNQAFNYPQQQLGVLEGSLGMTPHDTSSSGQSNTQTTTPTDWASLIKGGGDAASSLLGMFGAGSDKEMKTDITKLGKDPKTGLQMHAFRYKGDPKTYPKVVGPMAQEVQEKYPDKAKRLGGKLTVSPDVMSAAGVQGYAGGTEDVQPNRRAAGRGYYTPGSRLPYDFAYPSSNDPGTIANSRQIEQDQGPNVYSRPEDYVAPRGYAAGTPSVAAFLPPSSPGVAKGIATMSAFRPPVRLPKGYGAPKMQKFAYGTSDVQAPDMSGMTDSDFTSDQPGFLGLLGKAAKGASKVGGDLAGGGKPAAGKDDPPTALQPGQPSMGYLISGFAAGAPRVPGMMGQSDSVPAMLTPGEAVLTAPAAEHIGRQNIAQLNAFMPPVSARATHAPRAGARGIHGALANTKTRPRVAGGLSG